MQLLAASLCVVAMMGVQPAAHGLSELDVLQKRIPRTLPIELFEANAAGVEGVPLSAGASSPVQLTDANGGRFMCSYSHMPEAFRAASGGQRGWMPVPKLHRNDPVADTAKSTPASTPTIEKEQIISVLAGLKQLEDQCTSINKGWWTYRLCHGSAMTQFHKDAESDGVMDTTLCGKDPTRGKVHQPTARTPRGVPQVRGPQDIATVPVVQTVHYGGGTMCSRKDAAGNTIKEARKTTVTYRCCESVLSNGAKLSRSSTIVSLEEEPQCHYQVAVCSILACTSQQKLEMGSPTPAGESKSLPEPDAEALRSEPLPPAAGVNALLHAMRGSCLALHKGWWSYELCIGLNVKQFHAEVSEDKQSGTPTKQETVSNALGVYMPVTRWISQPESAETEPETPGTEPETPGTEPETPGTELETPDATKRAADAQEEVGFVLDPDDPTRSYVVQWYRGGSACDLHQDWLVNPTPTELPLVRGVQFVRDTWRTVSTVVGRLATTLYRRALGYPPSKSPRTASEKRAATKRRRGGSGAGGPKPTRSVEVRYVCPRGALLEAAGFDRPTGHVALSSQNGLALFLQMNPDGSAVVRTADEAKTWKASPTEASSKTTEIAYQDIVRLRSVREVAMCRYRMIVEMTSLCFHPAFAPKDSATGKPVLPGSARARAVCVAEEGSEGQADGVASSGAKAFGGWNMPVQAGS